LREEHRLRVFENKVLKRILGARRDEVRGEWRKQYKEELNVLCSSQNIWMMKLRIILAGHVARMGKSRGAYRVLLGKPEGKRSHGRPRRRWEDNMKVDLKEVVWGEGSMDWIDLVQNGDVVGLVNAVMNLWAP
jgi:hypothetical protein